MENGNANTNANIRPWDGFYEFGNSSYSNFSCPSSLAVHPQTPQLQLQNYHLPQHQNHHHHLTCLKLGKRPCYREEEAPEIHVAKRDKQLSLPPTSVPRCQVEGCNRSLSDAKEYHRRHKVCELHSKAPRVMVQGVEQRFCQQCSRFHVISEFDDAKRSCRRRLAGHNERRRKSNSHESIIRNTIHPLAIGGAAGHRFPNVPTSLGRALSLLSSKASPWGLTPDLSSCSSAALCELIAENRAAVLTHQICWDRAVWPNNSTAGIHSYLPQHWPHQHQATAPPRHLANGWAHLNDANGHVTLDLMQAPGTSLERVVRNDEEDCSEIWKSLEGTHVV